MMILSIYLGHSEGLTARNWRILEAAGAAIVRFGGPWCLAGDFNMEPSDIEQAHVFLRRIGGVVVAPQTSTCRSALGGRVIDFCLIAD
jgi:endonuclease/exonuclease/phosphatase family metal-dependent hydrolase